MGLFKRDGVWWMRFSHEGKHVQRSTETSDRRLAEKILAKVQTRDRLLTEEEQERLLNVCVEKENVQSPPYWLQEIVLFGLYTGMRMNEILSLEWMHVDLFRKTVTVMESKNGDKRAIPLNQTAFELLKKKAKKRHIKAKYVFKSEAGTKIDHWSLRRAFYSALKKAQITDFQFNDLRHTFATRLAQAGVGIYKLSKILGYRSISMKIRYSHHYPESLRDGVEMLDRKAQK